MILNNSAEYEPNTPQGETVKEYLARARADLEASISEGGLKPEEMERLVGAHGAIMALQEWV